jgi:hypothetical protein
MTSEHINHWTAAHNFDINWSQRSHAEGRKMIYTALMSIFISFHSPSPIELYTDGTARGGATTAEVTTQNNNLRLQGQLLGIKKADGSRVGFVGIRRPLHLTQPGHTPLILSFRVQGKGPLKMRAVFRGENLSHPDYPGTLTYQAPLSTGQGPDQYIVNLSTLRPSIRGRELNLNEAPILRVEDIQDVSLELMLSEQAYHPEQGIPFDLVIF